MNSRILIPLAFCFAGILRAQTAPPTLGKPQQPGQISSDSLAQIASSFFSTDEPVRPPVWQPTATDRREQIVHRIWISSMVAMSAASGLDAATSWGKHEGNGLLASPNGNFGGRGVAIKASMATAVILPQLLLRHRRNLLGKFSFANFVEAGIFTGVAIHNLGVTAPGQ